MVMLQGKQEYLRERLCLWMVEAFSEREGASLIRVAQDTVLLDQGPGPAEGPGPNTLLHQNQLALLEVGMLCTLVSGVIQVVPHR